MESSGTSAYEADTALHQTGFAISNKLLYCELR